MLKKGNTAEVIEYGKGKVCKLFYEGYPKELVRLEYRNAKAMYQEKLPVPKAYRIIKMNNRIGIIYERIYGLSLMEVLFQGTNAEAALDLFVSLHKEILTHCSRKILLYKEFLMGSLKYKSNYDIARTYFLLSEYGPGDDDKASIAGIYFKK